MAVSVSVSVSGAVSGGLYVQCALCSLVPLRCCLDGDCAEIVGLWSALSARCRETQTDRPGTEPTPQLWTRAISTAETGRLVSPNRIRRADNRTGYGAPRDSHDSRALRGGATHSDFSLHLGRLTIALKARFQRSQCSTDGLCDVFMVVNTVG